MGGKTNVIISKVLLKRQWTEAAPSYASVSGGDDSQPTTWVDIQSINPEADSETYSLRTWDEEDKDDQAAFGRDFWIDQSGEIVLKKTAPANKKAKVQDSDCTEFLERLDTMMIEATHTGMMSVGVAERAAAAAAALANAKVAVHQHKLGRATDEVLASSEEGLDKMKRVSRQLKEQHDVRQTSKGKRGREQEEDQEMPGAEAENESEEDEDGSEAELGGAKSIRILLIGSYGGQEGKELTVSLQNVQNANAGAEPSFTDVLLYTHRKGIMPGNMGLDGGQMERARTSLKLPPGAAVPMVPKVSMRS